MMPAIKRASDLLGVDVVILSTEIERLKKIGCYDEKWLQESKAKLLKEFTEEKKAKLFNSRMESQLKKHY